MKRDISKLKQMSPFDLLVIGGGIYGAWTAFDAARRGLKVAIIDKNDWASGTSSASTKLIHGGLRYLEHLRFDLVRTSLEERKHLTKIAPHQVIPLRFFIPIYKENRVGPMLLRTGLWLYDLLAGKDQPVSSHEKVSRRESLARYVFLNPGHLRGGLLYGDCQTDDFRFTLDVIQGAIQSGAVAVNYVKAISPVILENKIIGATVADQETGEKFEVRAKVVVNTAGPWASSFDESHHFFKNFIRMSKGVHLIMPPLPTGDAMLLMTRQDNRIFFMIPWYGKTLVGTTDSDYQGDPDEVIVTNEDVEYLLTETNRFLKDQVWQKEDVLGSFAGLRALKNEPGKPPSQVTREWTMVEPQPCLIVSVGGKFTTARVDAAKMVDRVMDLLNLPSSPEPELRAVSVRERLPSTPPGDFKAWRKQEIRENIRAGLDPEMAAWSIFRYGTAVREIREIIQNPAGLDNINLAERILPDVPFSKAEILFSAKYEMAVHLEDLIRRRIPLLILARMTQEIVREIVELVAPAMGWSPEISEAEIDAVTKKWGI